MTLNQLMVKAQCILLIDVNYRILKGPRKIKDLEILAPFIKGYKCPLTTPK